MIFRPTHNRRLQFAFIVCALLIALSASAAAQPTRVFRLGYLAAQDAASESQRTEAIRGALRDLGYIEGKNLAIEYRYADRKIDRAAQLAADLARLRVDLIVVTGGDRYVEAAEQATKTIPIVMIGVGRDPVEAGLIDNLNRPGGNVTGLTNITTDLSAKRLELFKEAVPKIVRVAVLYDPTTPSTAREVKEILPAAASALQVAIVHWQVSAVDDFDKVFAASGKQRFDGVYVHQGQLMEPNLKRIADLAAKSRLPSISSSKAYADAGGFMSYGPHLADRYRRVAYYIDKIFKGAKPADLPVEQPRKFELVINLKTAKQIGLTIPPNVLARADRVIR